MQTITFLNGFTLTFELSAVALLRSTNALIFAWIGGGLGGGCHVSLREESPPKTSPEQMRDVIWSN